MEPKTFIDEAKYLEVPYEDASIINPPSLSDLKKGEIVSVNGTLARVVQVSRNSVLVRPIETFARVAGVHCKVKVTRTGDISLRPLEKERHD